LTDQIDLVAWRCRHRQSVGTGRVIAASILFNPAVLRPDPHAGDCVALAGHLAFQR